MSKTEILRTVKLRKKITELAEASTCHAIPNIFRTEYAVLRVMWSVLLLVSFAGCAFFCTRGFVEYFKFETTTRIEIRSERALQLPSILVCPKNFFATKFGKKFALEKLNEQKDYDANNSKNLDELYNLKSKVGYEELFEDLEYLKESIIAEHYGSSVLNSVNAQLDQFILECELNLKDCDKKEIVWPIKTPYGNCVRIGNGQLLQKDSGYTTGLHLKIFTGFVNSDNPNHLVNTDESSGAVISIYNYSTQLPSENNELQLQTGACSYIRLKKIVSKNLPAPYSGCRKSNEFVAQNAFSADFALYNLSVYSKELCYTFCSQREFVNRCGCNLASFPAISLRYCLSKNETRCSNQVLKKFDIEKECGEYCPPECESVVYDYETSYDTFPNPGFHYHRMKQTLKEDRKFGNEDFDVGDMSYEQMKASVTCLYVFFDQIGYTSIEASESKSVIDLVSNIGGLFGLFMGKSFKVLFYFILLKFLNHFFI
jgi:hypothetical protein